MSKQSRSILEIAFDEAFGILTPKQDEYVYANTRYVGYGGARGGGKSHATRAKATLLAYYYPGIKILIVRESHVMLRRNYTTPMKAAYALFPAEYAPHYSDNEKAFIFPNGSSIELGYCATDSDTAGYVGNEWDVLFLDEATRLSEYQFYALNSCVRGVNKHPKRTYLTCNPGGPGHEWVKRLFIDRDYKKDEHAKDYTFIQARVYDNIPLLKADIGFMQEWKRYRRKHKKRKLDEEGIRACIGASTYVQSLSIGSPEMREAWLDGNWNIYSGKYFGEFDERVHTVEPFTIPSDWRKSAAIDYGLDCFAVLWFATSPDGEVVCYRNYEQSNMFVKSAALTFLEMSKDDDLEQVIMPPDLWSRHKETGRSTVDIFMEHGVHPTRANNSRVSGWLGVKEYIAYEKDDSGEITKQPRLTFFNTCRHIIKYIQLLQFDIKKPNDVDADLNHDWTHSPDALRYWCAAWQTVPRRTPARPHYNFKCERPKQTQGGYEVTESFLTGGY